jgi:PAS domain S-box-containing protein
MKLRHEDPPHHRMPISEDFEGKTAHADGIPLSVTAQQAPYPTEALALALKGGRMGWWSRDLVTEEVCWSPELEEIFGLAPGTFLGREQNFIEMVHPDDRSKVSAAVMTSLREGTDYSVDFRFLRVDGGGGWMDGRGRAIYNEAGQPIALFGIGIDITERKLAEQALAESRSEVAEAYRQLKEAHEELETRVIERTAQLEVANREMQSFNYMVAHDLRSPLRHIIASSKILMAEAADKLDPESAELLRLQEESATRLVNLVNDLLAYSRLSGQTMRREHVDITELARSLAETACSTFTGELSVQEDITADADPSLLKLVYQNLLENACKFSSNGGAIEIGKEGDNFFVRDSGIGFDMKHATRLFQPFERLVRDHEFPGTGIGLANVKRVVERHGGMVWAESVPGKGATFWFTLG